MNRQAKLAGSVENDRTARLAGIPAGESPRQNPLKTAKTHSLGRKGCTVFSGGCFSSQEHYPRCVSLSRQTTATRSR